MRLNWHCCIPGHDSEVILFNGLKATSNLPYSLEITLMETDSFSSDSWQRSNIIFFSSVVNLIVIVTELIINPKYSISRDGTKTNFFWMDHKARVTHFHIFLKHISNEYANVIKSSIYAAIFT